MVEIAAFLSAGLCIDGVEEHLAGVGGKTHVIQENSCMASLSY